MSKIEIQVPEGKRAEWVNGVLTLVDDEPNNVMERIKTFEDAYDALGDEHPFVKAYDSFECFVRPNVEEEYLKDIRAYLKLRIITAALNDGWTPKFAKDECKYFPWFYFYTEKDICTMSDDNRDNLINITNATDYSGVTCGNVYSDSSETCPCLCCQLAFKNAELVEYAGKQFIEIWADYICAAQTQNK